MDSDLNICDFVEEPINEVEVKSEIEFKEIELELNELSKEELYSFFVVNTKILIIGDEKSGKSTIIEKINIPSIVITDLQHATNFYSKENYIDRYVIYSNYGRSINSRIFKENTCLVMDNYFHLMPEIYIEDLNNNLEEKNILFFLTSTKFVINFDYIFICKLTQINEIQKIYDYLDDRFKIFNNIKELIYLINECTRDSILIIDCKCNDIKEIFKIFSF